MSKPPVNLTQMLLETCRKYPEKNALHSKNSGTTWIPATWSDVWKQVLRYRCLLASLGVRAGDRIAIWSENRPEWLYMDFAAFSLKAVTVPIYVTLANAEIQHILKDSNVRVLMVSTQEAAQRVEKIRPALPELKTILLVDTIADRLKSLSESEAQTIEKEVTEDTQDRLATIIYTSGTTGVPKGVMLNHGNFIANCLSVEKVIPIRHNDVHLSFLPLCHVFERMCGQYLMVRQGATVYYAENMDAVPQNMLETQPTILLAVPRLYEKIHLKVREKIHAASPFMQKIFNGAFSIGFARSQLLQKKQPIPLKLHILNSLVDRLIFRKIRQSMGGKIRFCVSGGAPLSADIARFFHACGILIIEGYGLTETSPVIAANALDDYKFGSVGKPLPDIEVRITRGEITTKSACVMQGYCGNEEATREVIREGWFYTGDLGELDEEGFLTITGRKKEIIVTSAGKKLCPELVESQFQKDRLIQRCILYGEGKNFLTALIVPNFTALKSLTKEQQKDAIQKALDQTHKQLAPFEQIKYFHILDQDFEVAAGELTPTLKPRRLVILERYKHHLDPFYKT